ncbi:Rossmann-fold NAD(P)-binding domain-containing protein [Cysteiniphilum halobium]|uniref:acetylornithine carbamoyltransferase n=1 Tax=Cysteiniphilum halobium TaxID=2219059 RepID=UPI000E64BB3E|nr:acetylornithine carbamoyltransferase [Cysteiniphilum halobium]
MQQYLSIKDIDNIQEAIQSCIEIKQNPYANGELGAHKTLGIIFLNPSLRTKISTIKAAQNIGLNVLPIDVNNGWALEFNEGVVMNTDKPEHIKEAAQVIARYCDIVAIRSFAKLIDKEADYQEQIFNAFKKYTNCPIVNLESALRHPLQSLADILTIEEHKTSVYLKRPKVVLSWAPHVNPLPHAVANSFAESMQLMDYTFVVTHPEGYELDRQFIGDAKVIYDQDEAFKDADFIYVKNWSSTKAYGKVINTDAKWMITQKKLKNAPNAKVMHCLPVRRNLVIADDVLDSKRSIVIAQAENRLYAAQYILSKLVNTLKQQKLKAPLLSEKVYADEVE